MAELDAAEVIRRIESQELPREAVLSLARGFLPLPQDQVIEVLATLALSTDRELSILSRASLADIPVNVLAEFARDRSDHRALESLALAAEDRAVLEAIIRNPETRDETVEKLARKARGPLQEVIVINQARVLRHPAILDALLENPSVTSDVRRRVLETREEFFEKKQRIEEERRVKDEQAEREREREEAAAEEALSAEKEEELRELLSQIEESADGSPTLLKPIVDEPENESAWNRILKMSASEKVQLAFKGDRTERGILVRDRNRLVCSAVLRSPRITETEVESFAGMRNIETEVLRMIGSNREWTRKYPIVFALVRNPKAPISSVLPLISRLTTRDLRSLSKDKGVAEAVRVSARKLFLTKSH